MHPSPTTHHMDKPVLD